MRTKLPVWVLTVAIVATPLSACHTADRTTAPAGADTAPGDSALWNQLRAGLSHVEVLDLLGSPLNAEITRLRTTWYYSDRAADGPSVTFDTRSMTLEQWRMP